VVSSKKSLFIMCVRSSFDPDYPRYPSLPKRECRGFEEADRDHDHNSAEPTVG
jgi:hypothetical protein